MKSDLFSIINIVGATQTATQQASELKYIYGTHFR